MANYGTPNADYLRTWRKLEHDGPMWALNLMRYFPIARYADGRQTTLSGQQADDLYAPHDALAAIGGRSVLRTKVIHQLVGDGARWDRVAIGYYPTRCAQLDMQQLDIFKAQHVHKVAAMEFTIVVASFPNFQLTHDVTLPEPTHLLLQVMGDASAPDEAQGLNTTRIATFDIENVIIGDDRRYAQARWDAISAADAQKLVQQPTRPSSTSYVLVLEVERSAFIQSLIDPRAIPARPD